MNDEETSIGRLVRRRDLYDSVLAASERLNTILQAVIDGRGAVGALIMNERTADDTTRLLGNLRVASDRMLTTDGPLGVLLNDGETARNLQGILANLDTLFADARAGKGMLGRVLQDEDLAEEFGSVVARLNLLLEKANDPTAGAIGALTSDPQTAADLKQAIANVRDVTDSLTQKDGLLGALINDEEITERFRRILTQVARAIEDAREAAPIGNFVQVLLGTF
jgi:hypothetical protein